LGFVFGFDDGFRRRLESGRRLQRRAPSRPAGGQERRGPDDEHGADHDDDGDKNHDPGSLLPVRRSPAMQPGRREGARAALPLAVVIGGFGVSFGVLARSAGTGALAPIVMSATTFAGSAQFAAASILGIGCGLTSAIVAAVP